MLERRFRPLHPVDLRLTLGHLRHGVADPTMRLTREEVWRATRTRQGAATLRLRAVGGELWAQAWGPGAAYVLDAAPALVGADDDAGGFAPRHPVVAHLARRLQGLRIPRSGAVVEALVPVVLAQKVTGVEAKRAYAAMVRALGEPAPGPAGAAGLRLPPSPERLARTPSYAFHPFGVERRRAETLRRVAGHAARLEEAAAMLPSQAAVRLRTLPGVGPWSAAKVALVALGDADAVCVGDYHLPNQVAWALAGEPRGDDARMLELLEPYRGHRGRVTRLLVAAGVHAPRYGPRSTVRSLRGI